VRRAFALLALCLAPAAAAAAVTVVCPIDGKEFGYEPAPATPIRGRYLDMKPVAAYPTPWPLPQCPGNGFVVYKQGGFSAEELARLAPFVASDRYRAMLGTDTNYYLAATLRRKAGDPAYDVAWTLAEATWQADGDPARYKRYAEEALATFNSLPEGRALPRRQNVLREMMSGELERRLGLFEAAEKRFRRVRDEAEFATSQLQQVIDLQLRLIRRRDTGSHRIPP